MAVPRQSASTWASGRSLNRSVPNPRLVGRLVPRLVSRSVGGSVTARVGRLDFSVHQPFVLDPPSRLRSSRQSNTCSQSKSLVIEFFPGCSSLDVRLFRFRILGRVAVFMAGPPFLWACILPFLGSGLGECRCEWWCEAKGGPLKFPPLSIHVHRSK